MPSDSVARFYALARTGRVLPAAVADRLAADPTVPAAGVRDVCDALVVRGELTPFQAARLAAGDAPTFAGYLLLDDLGPCPGGTRYRAVHPTLGTPVDLRRLARDFLAGEPLADYLGRARAAAELLHPHLTQLLDVGAEGGDIYTATEPFDGADLATLVAAIGPMPAGLAATYARQVAVALAAAHARGLTHGAVAPAAVVVGPLVPLRKPKSDGSPRSRPADGAAARLSGLGLTPVVPSRLVTPADDVRGLGRTLYFLLAGRAGKSTIGNVRPDLPADFAHLIAETLGETPPTAEVVADRLAPFASPGDARRPPADLADLVDDALAGSASDIIPLSASDDADVLMTPAEPVAWTARPAAPVGPAFTPVEYGTDAPPAATKPAGPPGRQVWLWVAVAAGLQLLAVSLWWAYFYRTR